MRSTYFNRGGLSRGDRTPVLELVEPDEPFTDEERELLARDERRCQAQLRVVSNNVVAFPAKAPIHNKNRPGDYGPEAA
jgi:hypothetical protein